MYSRNVSRSQIAPTGNRKCPALIQLDLAGIDSKDFASQFSMCVNFRDAKITILLLMR